ncbi:Protein flp [Daldinia childiae]|uniref:Protein flp n=1 Tax=Daldinia childiae TaxID=326645 RepID=UPI001446499E|nr:Protein flp [Daldinia childiae]KAF3069829.1 Protein flp [Daldinia childiae]
MDVFHSEAFSSSIKELMDEHHVPGFSIAIVHNGKVASAGYGYADVESSKPCTADTLFDIASSSKSLTAAAVALLIDDDEKYPEVQYEAIMSRLLPDDFLMPSTEYTESVTVEDILSHRSGMPRHDDSYMGPHAAHPDDARSVTRNLRNLPVAAPLRVKYLYCNMMYTAAAYLVEAKTQQTFSSFLEERFFQPLDMKSTSVQPARARAKGLADRMATGYCWNEEKSTYKGFPPPDCPEGEGAGSIITSANDFIKWAKALLYHEGPINKKVYEGLVRLRSLANPDAQDLEPFTSPIIYAAGIEVYYYRGYTVVGHDGMISGFTSLFFFLPQLGFGAVMMGNALGAEHVANAVRRKLFSAILKVPEEELAKNVSSDKKGDNKEDDGTEDKEKEDDEVQPQVTPLSAYVGKYWNPGYHTITVQIKDEKLFIDATDRSFRSTITFDHVSDQTKYTARLCSIYEDGDELLKAEFVFGGGRAIRLGIDYQDILNELIWFEFMPEEKA